MKNILKYPFMLCMLILSLSCKYDHAEYPVYPDVAIEERGFYLAEVNSVYPEQDVDIVIARTQGLSKEIAMEIGIDTDVLDAYNELYGTQYELAPAEYYSFEDDIILGMREKEVVVPVRFRPASYINGVGWSNADKYVIPLRIKSVSTTVISEESDFEVIIGFRVSPPTVSARGDMRFGVSFITGLEIPQEVVLTADVNFTTLDPTKVMYEVDPEGVSAYNDANDTDYKLLPANTYELKTGYFDSGEMTLSVPLELSAWMLDQDEIYILPLKIVSEEYTALQSSDIYVIVDIGTMKITIDRASYEYPVNKLALTQDIVVTLNAVIDSDMVVEFTYEPADVDEYNQANGTSYKTLAADKLTLPAGTIEQGKLSVDLTLAADLSSIPFNEVAGVDDKYMIILSIDETKTVPGTQVEDPQVVIIFERTVFGYYDIDGPSNYMQNVVQRNTRGFTDEYMYMNTYWTWDHGYQWNIEWDQPVEGFPNRRKITEWSSVTSGPTMEEQQDWVYDNNSYFDMETGEIYHCYKYFWNQDDKDAGNNQNINCYLTGQRYPN